MAKSEQLTLPGFGELVREKRRSKQWRVEKLASEADVSYKTVLNIEKGRTIPRVDHAVHICAALDIPLDSLSAYMRSLLKIPA